MRKNVIVIVLLTSFYLISIAAYSQSNVQDYLSKYTSENGTKYMQPFADAFSANLNSGLFHSARLKKLGFQMYLGIETPVAIIGSSQKNMTASTEGDFFPEKTVEGVPTIFGSNDGKKVEDSQSGLEYVFPGGLDLDYLPMVAPQLTIGSVYGTDLTLRYASTDRIEDIGTIDLFGWGIRHSIDQYLKIPLNLTLGYYHQSFKAGNYVDATSSLISLQTSYSIPIITFYGGLGLESGSTNIEYEYDDTDGSTQKIAFDLDPGNTMRLTLGLGFNFGPVKLHGEYNLASQSTLSVGLGIGIGE